MGGAPAPLGAQAEPADGGLSQAGLKGRVVLAVELDTGALGWFLRVDLLGTAGARLGYGAP